MKDVPAGAKYNGLRSLPTAVRNKMGYMKAGGEKLLMKVGGMVDFAEMAAKKMRMGGGTNGSKTYSGPKKGK